LLAEIARIMNLYENEKCAHPIYKGCLKDEVRTRKKCETGGTRMFYIGPLPYLVISRMFLAPIYTLMSEFPDLFSSTVGVNIISLAEKYAQIFKDKLLGSGDFKGYDFSILVAVRRAVNTLIIKLASFFGYNDHAIIILTGVLCDNLFPVIMINGVVYITCGMTVSGMYGTTENNCFSTKFSFMYIFYKKAPDKIFSECVVIRVNGDDSKYGVKDDKLGFDMYYCEKAFLEELGMVFTTPDKKAVDTKYYKEEQVEYLKRRIIYREDFGFHVAQLDKESILKMGSFFLPSNAVSQQEQFAGTLRSFCIESFQHLSRNKYEDLTEALVDKVFPKIDFDDYHRKHIIPTFDECFDICFSS
jgi:hypothetical protein